jgi:hypothetical protein
MEPEPTLLRAARILRSLGYDERQIDEILTAFANEGIRLSHGDADEMVCTWVDVERRAVPKEADTIIRTITRMLGERTWSTTHWLDGLRGPRDATR